MNKEEIIQTRQQGLGSSDARMVAKIAKNGCLTDADRQRIAIMLGMETKREFRTIATEYGNTIEEKIFSLIKEEYPGAVSNPFYKSERLSDKYGFGIFGHIDFEIETDDKLIWIENKATIEDKWDSMQNYENQLAWHWMLLKEKAFDLHKKPVLMFSHYHVKDYESFNSENFTITALNNDKYVFDRIEKELRKGFEIISEAITDFKYEPREELYADNLPAPVQEKIQQIAACIIEMKTAEKRVDEFKERMKTLMTDNHVKSISNDFFRITLVGESITNSFDKKSFEREYPEIAQKFTKQVNKQSYILLNIK